MSNALQGPDLDPALAIELEPQVTDGLRAWQRDVGVRISWQEWLTTGHTRAKVAVVLVQEPGTPPARVIMKVCPPDRLTAREPRLHSLALESSPDAFAAAHLVEQPYDTIECADKWRILFQAVAGDSLRRLRPLESVVRDERLPVIVSLISRTLLGEWNKDFKSIEIHPQELLKRELDTKADRNGPLVAFVRDQGCEHDAWVRFADDAGTSVPNAVTWSLDRALWTDERLWAHVGHTHGDLHLGNVLIEVDLAPSADHFRLIDLSAYSSDGSVVRDLMHLALSLVGESFIDTAARRRELLTIALAGADPVGIELLGLRQSVDAIRTAADAWQAPMTGMGDDWNDQVLLALVSEALEFVGRRSLPTAKRAWFMQLASIALGRFLVQHNMTPPPRDPAKVPMIGRYVDREIEQASDELMDACANFGTDRTNVCILAASLDKAAAAAIGACPWAAIFSFEPDLDTGGALSEARAGGGRIHRLVAIDQTAEFARGSTTWFALGGLADQAETIETGLRAWRRKYRPLLDQGLAALARSTSRPLTAVVFGDPDDRVRSVVQAIDDRFPGRARIVLVGDGDADLGDFTDVRMAVDVGKVAATLPCQGEGGADVCAVPGPDGPLLLPAEDDEWIREQLDLVDLSAGVSAEGIDDVGVGFLRGRLISWFELGLETDVRPRITDDLAAQIRSELATRDTKRVALLHHPGSGGTTLSRRLAWELHREFPTVYSSGTQDDAGLAERVEKLGQLSGLPVFVVLEQTTDQVADRIFNRLRRNSVGAVMLVVTRRLGRRPEAGPRSFYLGPASTIAEVADLARRYAEYVPARADVLAKIEPDKPTAVPFYFGLLAFEADYDGLPAYVGHSISDVSSDEREVLLFIALTHRYGGTPVAADLFADVLNVSPDNAVRLDRALREAVRALLIEETPGFWRTVHWLVAAELIRQLLLPTGGADPDAWRLGLSTLAIRVIDQAKEVFGSEPPDDVKDVLERLFIVRENRELVSDSRARAFSELLEDVPSIGGRLEVLRHLAESFPAEAHYWAHYGRLLSASGDMPLALNAINQALAIEENDSVLFHMRGMVYARSVREMTSDARAKRDFDEAELLRAADLALADFLEASRLDDSSEYPQVATVQVVVRTIEAAAEHAGSPSRAAFLARPAAVGYRALLERAETAVAFIKEMSGGERSSAAAEAAAVSLAGLYDDYSTLLQGWRNLLDRGDVIASPIRRRLVGAYMRRAGGWQSLDRDDSRKVMALLEENLSDDATDTASLRDWLKVARREEGTLDRASELVAYWATQSNTRDALYYDYVIAVLQVMDGRDSMWREAERKIERSRERAANFGNRRFSFEWLGHGSGLAMLVHNTELPDGWEMNSPDDAPQQLRRVSARVSRIASPQAGTLRLEHGGLDAFFVPARAGVVRGRHENAMVEAVIGFAYDGIRAWSVRTPRDG